MTVLQSETRQGAAGRTLVAPELFDRLTARVVADEQVDAALAARIVDQALGFLGACAVSTQQLSPSATVDIGWHTFILHTKDYREFCEHVAGRFIDHVPTGNKGRECQMCNGNCESDGGDGKHSGALSASLTALAVAAAGFVVDEPLWASTGNCSQCHNGCHNDPPPNPPSPS
jgi:hypothetical protein